MLEAIHQPKTPEQKFIDETVDSLKDHLKGCLVKGSALTPLEVSYLLTLKNKCETRNKINLDIILARLDPAEAKLTVYPNSRYRMDEAMFISFNEVLKQSNLTPYEIKLRQKAFADWVIETNNSKNQNALQQLAMKGARLARRGSNALAQALPNSPTPNLKHKANTGDGVQSQSRRRFFQGAAATVLLGGLGTVGYINRDEIFRNLNPFDSVDLTSKYELEKTLFTPQEAGLSERISPARALVGLAGGRYKLERDKKTSEVKFIDAGKGKAEKSDAELKEALTKISQRANSLGLKLNDLEVLSALDLWTQAPEAVLNKDNFGFLEIYKNLTEKFDTTKTPANLLLLARVYSFMDPKASDDDTGTGPKFLSGGTIYQIYADQQERQEDIYAGMPMFNGLSKSPFLVDPSIDVKHGQPIFYDTFDRITSFPDGIGANLRGGNGLSSHSDHGKTLATHVPSLNSDKPAPSGVQLPKLLHGDARLEKKLKDNQYAITTPLAGTVVAIKNDTEENKVESDGNHSKNNLAVANFGNRVVIQLKNGLFLHLLHLPKNIDLKVGQVVKAGDVIAVGESDSGSGQNPHSSAAIADKSAFVGDDGGLYTGTEYMRDVTMHTTVVGKNGVAMTFLPMTGVAVDSNDSVHQISSLIGAGNTNYIHRERKRMAKINGRKPFEPPRLLQDIVPNGTPDGIKTYSTQKFDNMGIFN